MNVCHKWTDRETMRAIVALRLGYAAMPSHLRKDRAGSVARGFRYKMSRLVIRSYETLHNKGWSDDRIGELVVRHGGFRSIAQILRYRERYQ